MKITNHQPFTFPYISFTAVPSVADLSFRLRAADQKEEQNFGKRAARPGERTLSPSSEKEIVRQKVNEWILHGGEFDGVVDLDQALRDPNHPTQRNPAYGSGDHLHPNNVGTVVEANAFPLTLLGIR